MTAQMNAKASRLILVPTDFSEGSARALSWALGMAKRMKKNVLLFHALGPIESDNWSPLRLSPEESVLREDAHKIVRNLMERTAARHGTEALKLEAETRRGRAASTIVAVARERNASLIVMGTHGRRGAQRFLLGSVAEEVARTAPCPVLLVPGGEAPAAQAKIERMLLPVDFSPRSRQVLAWARTLASLFSAEAMLLHVLEHYPAILPYEVYYAADRGVMSEVEARAREEMQALVKELASDRLPVDSYIDAGHPAELILDVAEEKRVDLIVMASHGRSGLPRFLLGSVTETVIRAAPCPVLVVHAADAAPTAAVGGRPGAALAVPVVGIEAVQQP